MGTEWRSGLLAAAIGVVAGFGTGGSPPPAPAGDALARPALPFDGRELVELRTRRSRTFALADGSRVAQVYGGPIHFKRDGRWRRIDSRLVDSPAPGYALRNRANDWTVDLPGRLEAKPVKVTDEDGAWASFQLRSAASGAEARAVEARYESARPGVDVRYEVLAEGVKETLVLERPDAPSAYAFDIAASRGIRARLTRGGGIVFADRAGRTRFTVPAPTVWDASGELVDRARYELSRAAAGWTLTVRVDARWLRAPGRKFPVSVDPYLTVGAARDCTLDSGSPTTSYCGVGTVEIGWNGHHDHNAVFDFNLKNQLPAGVMVLDSYLATYVTQQTTGAWKSFDTLRLTQPWTNAATWNKRDATTAWGTPGGDGAAVNLGRKNIDHSSTGKWSFWPLRNLVQSWVDREAPEHGILLRDHDPQATSNIVVLASSENATASRRPYVTVRYWARTGIADHTFEVDDLPDGSTSMVNVANGNLLVQADDVSLASAGPESAISRYYNGLEEGTGTFGNGSWQLSTDTNTFWTAGDNRVHFDATGAHHVFEYRHPPDTPGWKPAPDTGMEFNRLGTNNEVVTDPDMNDRLFYNDDGQHVRDEDDDGNVVRYTYSSKFVVDYVTDAQNRVIDLQYNTAGDLSAIRDAENRLHTYGYTSGRLTSYTDPTGNVTRYHYDGSGRLYRIEDAPGHYAAQYAYDSLKRVTAVTYDVGTASQRVTTFSYQAPTAPCTASDLGKTVVTAGGTSTTYCYAPDLEITFSNAPGFEIEDPGDPGPSVDEPYPELEECTIDPEWPTDYCGGDALPDEQEGFSALAVPDRFWGISDDQTVSLATEPQIDMFSDRRFQDLELNYVRNIVSWNVAVTPGRELDETKAWVQNALDANLVPLISFQRCSDQYVYLNPRNASDPLNNQLVRCGGDTQGNSGVAPSPGQYADAVEAFLDDSGLGRVNEFTAWNEPNHGSTRNRDQPTWDHPYEAGRFWRILNEKCTVANHACRVAAGDFQDSRLRNVRTALGGNLPPRHDPPSDVDRYAAWYWRWYLRGMGGRTAARDARYWAWHAYSDGRNAGVTGERRWPRYTEFRQAVGNVNPDARVWASEQGVVLHQGTMLEAGRRATVRVRTMRAFVRGEDAFVEQPRIKRFYYYQFRGDRPVRCHDSGLLQAPKRNLYDDPSAASGPCGPRDGQPPTTDSRAREIYRIFKTAVNSG